MKIIHTPTGKIFEMTDKLAKMYLTGRDWNEIREEAIPEPVEEITKDASEEPKPKRRRRRRKTNTES